MVAKYIKYIYIPERQEQHFYIPLALSFVKREHAGVFFKQLSLSTFRLEEPASLLCKAAIKACSKSPYKSSEGSHAHSLPLGWDLPTRGAREAPQLQHRTTSPWHHQEHREDSPEIPARVSPTHAFPYAVF